MCPHSTVERASGMEGNRSKMPLCNLGEQAESRIGDAAFNVLHLCGREQLFQFFQRAARDNPAPMQNGNPIGELQRPLL